MDLLPNNTLYVNNINEKVKKETLKKALYFLFGQFGVVLDIVAIKTFRLRGQAFIVYQDIASATAALRSLQGFSFYEKPLKINYARTKSDIIAKREGVYEPRDRISRPTVSEILKEKQELKRAKYQNVSGEDNSDLFMEEEDPNEILFIQNLPEDVEENMVVGLFKQFPGFKEVRTVPGRSDIAFVEFEIEKQAEDAKHALHRFKITPENELLISFAKK
eukprot:Sdes_comp9053_c0_seq1m486